LAVIMGRNPIHLVGLATIVAVFLAGCQNKCEAARQKAHADWTAIAEASAAHADEPMGVRRAAENLAQLFDEKTEVDAQWFARVEGSLALMDAGRRLIRMRGAAAEARQGRLAAMDAAFAQSEKAVAACRP